MERLYKAVALIVVVLSTLFLFLWAASLCSCTSQVEQYMQVRYPSCEVSTLEETSWHAILEITCPGEEPFTKKVRKK